MLTQIINGRILTPQGWLRNGSVILRDGKILEVTNCDLAVIGAELRRIKGVRLSDEEVSYELPVSRYVEMRSELPLSVRNIPAGRHLDVFPSRATVILHCTFPPVRNPFESFELFIDYEDFASSLSGRCVARVKDLPRGVLDYRVEPAVFDCIETD